MSENTEQSISGDVAGLEREAKDETPAVEAQFATDHDTFEKVVTALKEFGHDAESSLQLVTHLWNRGLVVVRKDETPNKLEQPDSIAGD